MHKTQFIKYKPFQKAYSLTLILLLLLTFDTSAQVAADYASIVHPPTDAAALTSRINQVDISHYNGTANFNIPLYVLKGKDLSYPLSISYRSEIDLEQKPSAIGEGWELNGVASVSRMIRGYSDFKPKNASQTHEFYGCVSNKKLIYSVAGDVANPVTTYWDDPVSYHDDWSPYDVVYPQDDIYDTEHDIFYYNTGTGLSGSFMMGEKQDGNCDFFHAVKPDLAFFNEQNIKINHHPVCKDNDFWEVYDLSGNKYLFGGDSPDELVEWSKTYSVTSTGGHWHADANLLQATKWFLEYIESPTGERIEFEYEDYMLTQSMYRAGHRSVVSDGTNKQSSGIPPTTREVDTKRLKRIKLLRTNGDYTQVTFNYSSNARVRDEYQLDQIVVTYHNSSGTQIETFDQINFNYRQSAVRHFLSEITNTNNTLRHNFEYYSPDLLGNENTNSIDYWGYYNGKTNTTKLPPYSESFIENIDEGSNMNPGTISDEGDRKPAVDKSYYGLLKKITNPFGGETEIVYEQNRWNEAQKPDVAYSFVPFSEFNQTINQTNTILEASVCDSGGGSPVTCSNTESSMNFYIEYSRTMELIYEIDAESPPSDFRVFIEDSNGNQVANLNWYGTTNGEITTTFTLDQGAYTLKAIGKLNSGNNSFARAELYSVVTNTINTAGGAGNRVKEIKLKSNYGDIHTKSFKYYDGVLYKIPWNGSITAGWDQGQSIDLYRASYSSKISFYDPGLGNVGYGKVEEYLGSDNSEEGRITYEFYNQPLRSEIHWGSTLNSQTLPQGSLKLPHYFPYESKRTNGKVKKVTHERFDESLQAYEPALETSYTYTTDGETDFYGSRIKNAVNNPGHLAPYEYASYETAHDLFLTAVYKETVGVIRTSTEVTSTYDDEDNAYTITKTYNGYHSTFSLPTDVETQKPGKSVQELFSYTTPLSTKATLRRNHEVIENGDLIGGESIGYHIGSNKVQTVSKAELVAPVARSGSTLSIHSNVQLRTQLSGSNIVEIEEVDGKYTTYFFNSRDVYPIASAQNARDGQIFFTSFELTGSADTNAKAGENSHGSGSLNVSSLFSPPSDGETYLMSYWYWSNDQWNFSGLVPYATQISQGSKIDNLRVFPDDSKMTTMTYDVRGNVTSATSADNITVHYQYDSSSRVIKMLDQYKNITNTYLYHLSNQ